MTPIVITSLTQLPDGKHPAYQAPTFDAALAEYERKYGAAGRCWQYKGTFYFEEAEE